MELEVSRDVAAEPARVWETITDLASSARVISAIEAVERLDGGGPFVVGTSWRETRTMFGKRATEEMRVAAIDPGRSYTVVSESGGTSYTSVMAVEPAEPGHARLSMSFAGRSSTLGGRLLGATVGRAFAPATRKALRKDLDDIAAHLEASSEG